MIIQEVYDFIMCTRRADHSVFRITSDFSFLFSVYCLMSVIVELLFDQNCFSS